MSQPVQPPQKIEESNLFVVDEVSNIIKESVEGVIGGGSYQPNKVGQWTSNIVEQCLNQLTALKKPFKYIVNCVIMQKTGAGLHTASSCYWDNTTDGSCTVRWENKTMYCIKAAVGKTAILEQLVNGDHVVGSPMFSTIEDIYVALVDTDRGQKEKVHFYDTAGLDSMRAELSKHYLSFADGYVLVYDVTNELSFQCMDRLKKFIEKNKEKKEAVIITLGNKCDLKDSKQVDFNAANRWAQVEKVRLWEVSVSNRNSLMDSFVWLTSKMTQPQSKRFPPFGGDSKRTKTSNADF